MKKKLMALILCMVMALGLTACRMSSDGKRDADNSDVTQSQTQSYEAKDITVAALKGPTAIGMVKLMEDSKEKKTANNYDFKIAASADEFSSLLIKGDVQIAALPCNAAATLYNKSNGKIKVLGINTLGVLYIVEKGNTVQNVADLKGKTIYTTGKGTTPEYTLKYLLKKAGLDAEKDVNIEFKSEASESAAMLASSDSGAVAMLPQPYVTTVMAANSDVRIALDVTKEWEKLSTDGSTVVTGVIAVNADYYEKNKELFRLERPLMQGLFIKVPLTAPELNKVRRWYKTPTQDAVEHLEKYSLQNAVKYEYFYDKWVPMADVLDLIPLKVPEVEDYVNKNRHIELKDTAFHYFLNVSDFRTVGQQEPYEFARPKVKDMVLNLKQVEFMRAVKDDLYQQAVKRDKIKYN